MSLTKLTAALTWRTTKGRELVRLDEGANAAEVVAARCTEDELRALAQACLAAADQIRDCRAGDAKQAA